MVYTCQLPFSNKPLRILWRQLSEPCACTWEMAAAYMVLLLQKCVSIYNHLTTFLSTSLSNVTLTPIFFLVREIVLKKKSPC